MFTDKVVSVTGAASGIGRSAALAFAEKGARVAISDIDSEGLDQTKELLKKTGAEFELYVTDIADPAQVESMFQSILKKFGRLDAACNNAGIGGPLAASADYSIEEWDRVINVNLRGQWLCMRQQIPAMLSNGGGSIVNVTSILGNVGFANAPAYASAKHGLEGLTKTAALEYSASGIRINSVAPGFIATEMLEKAGLTTDEEKRKAIEQLHPIGRLGTAREVADTIVWLSSDEASFITGHCLLVDGGYTAR